MQVGRRACDQHPKGDEYRGDRSKAQTCPQLHCLHMGPQVVCGFLGWDEGVSLHYFPCQQIKAVVQPSSCYVANYEELGIRTSFKVLRIRLIFGSLNAGNPSLLMKYRPSKR